MNKFFMDDVHWKLPQLFYFRRLPNVQTKRLIHILSKFVQVEVSFFGAKVPHSYPAYEGLPAAADFWFKKSPKIAKNHQILPKLAVSQQNKTYVVTLMLRAVVGTLSK
jgi:hypothetical protein